MPNTSKSNPVWKIGSAPECDIVVDQATVSSEHCQLTQLEDDKFVVEDLDSTNGTFVNGKQITSSVVVSPRDGVTLGQVIPMPWPKLEPKPLPKKENWQNAEVDGASETVVNCTSMSKNRRKELILGVAVMSVLVFGVWFAMSWFDQGGYKAADSNEVNMLEAHEGPAWCFAITNEGDRIISGGADHKVIVWNAQSGEAEATLQVHSAPIRSVAVSADGKLAVSGDDQGKLSLWDLETFTLKKHLVNENTETFAVTSVAFYPAMTHVAVGRQDGQIEFWNLSDNKIEQVFEGHVQSVTSLGFTADRQYLISSGEDGSVRSWEVSNGDEHFRMNGHVGKVNGLDVSSDGKRAVSIGVDSRIVLWDLEKGKEISRWPPEDQIAEAQTTIAFSPGYTRVITGGNDGQLYVWSCSSGEKLTTFTGHQQALTDCAYFGNSMLAASSSRDGTVRLWKLPFALEDEGHNLQQSFQDASTRADQLIEFSDSMNEGKEVMDDFQAEADKAEKLAKEDGEAPKLDLKKLDRAKDLFADALLKVEKGTLEYRIAYDAEQSVLDTKAEVGELESKTERYKERCEAGKKALEDQQISEAVREFKMAQKIFPDRDEAKEGLEKANEALLVKRDLERLQVRGKELGWDFKRSEEGLLSQGKRFAYLLTSMRPPMTIGLHTSHLTWNIRMESSQPIVSDGLQFQIRVIQKSTQIELAKEVYPIKAGLSEYVMKGSAPPINGSWESGEYDFVTDVITGEETIPYGDPIPIPVGILNWMETKIDLTPETVQQGGYRFETDAVVEKGDALRLVAGGDITPGRLWFYKQLTNDKRLRRPFPIRPEGYVPKQMGPEIANYKTVQARLPFGALLFRLGQPKWTPYPGSAIETLADRDGTIWLSINSVVEKRKNPRSNFERIPKENAAFWLRDCGAFEVTILVGKFDFPVDLKPRQKAGLLQDYK